MYQETIAGTTKMDTVPTSAKTTADGKVSFTLEYPLNTDMGSGRMDLTRIVWNIHVYHEDKPGISDDVIIYQYPSIYGEQNITASDATAWLNGAQFNYGSGNSPVYSNGNNTTRKSLGSFNGGTGSVQNSMEKLVLTVSSLASLQGVDAYKKNDGTQVTFSDVVIGDPRVKISTQYNITRQGLEWDRDDLGSADDYIDNYLIGHPDKSDVIAPRFMFPSGRIGANRTNSQWRDGSWRSAAMRCAAYQEDGYPAGRWRLPTESEVAFVRELQRNNYIDGLFTNANRYWTSSGTYYYQGTCTDPGDSQTTASVRCVYDLWYWGDEPYNNDGKQIKGDVTGSPATVWLGYLTD